MYTRLLEARICRHEHMEDILCQFEISLEERYLNFGGGGGRVGSGGGVNIEPSRRRGTNLRVKAKPNL